MNETTFKRVQEILSRNFGIDCVHPSPLVGLENCNALDKDVFDLSLFDPRFLFPLLLCCRWLMSFLNREV